MKQEYQIKAMPQCSREAVVKGEFYRITVLTPKLLRMEYNKSGNFEDRPTQCILNRDFQVPDFRVSKQGNDLLLETESLRLIYDQGEFCHNGLSIQLTGGGTWHFDDEPYDLGGTARTLDGADGAIPLEHGIVSRCGFTVLDDSRSMILTEDGWVEPRSDDATDLYFFGYGHKYQQCIKDFYHLCGKTPLLPRWALGNWWSRYHKYTELEYKELMERFKREHCPFSVAVLDMDWHLVEDVDPKYGGGWTGYTWNKKFFPNPPEFLEWLHDQGMKVTLNVHPADGVRAFEDSYPAIAKEMGVNVKQEETVDFDVTDPHFLESYFKYLHHPLEYDGVDFWWIDWQQGNTSKMPGLDPLWMLNHYHYLDSKRQNTRPLIFSRYAGVGSHRYPIGFSGDTSVTWESLRFQPYFTSTASNVGYGWWSHDIGGHQNGYKNDELATRWVQFGVFSPILRLHSTSNPFNSKEPWRYNIIAERIIKDFLLLRHRLVPYLYTMNRYASRDGRPLIQPMYWLEPEQPESYEVPNEYSFGTELIVAPITSPAETSTCMAEVQAWLPEGIWFDFFTNRMYYGNQLRSLWRPLNQMPVLAKSGAIIPMADLTDYTNSTENPAAIEVRVFPGANGNFTLWEDTGDLPNDDDENWARTDMTLLWNQTPCFVISATSGNLSVLPKSRRWLLRFCGTEDVSVTVKVEDLVLETQSSYDDVTHTLTVTLSEIPITSAVQFIFEQGMPVAKIDYAAEIYLLLDRAQIAFNLKVKIQQVVEKYGVHALPTLEAMKLERPLFSALSEILLT